MDSFYLRYRNQYYWMIPLLVFVVAVMVVGVAHETPFDEDFCYVWTVRHLLDTGEYRLHDWACPNIRFQAYWGGLFSRFMPGLFSGPRLSTITLSAVGLAAFCRFTRYGKYSYKTSLIAAISLIACPFYLNYSTCFTSDGPFLALALISLWGFMHAWKLNSPARMFLASLVACAAILTRQTGVAIVGALFMAWLLSGNRRIRLFPAFCGLLLPVVALFWSVKDPSAVNNLGSSLTRVLQAEYLSSPATVISQQGWKLSMVVIYVAILIFPLSTVASMAMIIRLNRLKNRTLSNSRAKQIGISLAISCGLIISGIAYHSLIMHKPLTPPYLPWYWGNLYGGIFLKYNLLVAILLPVLFINASVTGAILIMEGRHQLICRRFLRFNWLFWFTVLALGQVLIFYKLGDKYILLMVPYVILVLVRWCRPLIARYCKLLLCICLAIIAIQAVYLNSSLRVGAAQWREAERLRQSGVPLAAIGADWQWVAYYRFNEFAQAEWIRGDLGKAQGRFWAEWLPEQERQAQYRIKTAHSEGFCQPHGWKIINKLDMFCLTFNEVSFLPLSYRPVSVYTLQRLSK